MNDQGAALPLAVFGLLILSLLATSALSSAGTELAMSRAHFEGVRGLYGADGAVETFAATLANATETGDALMPTAVFVGSPDGRAFQVTFSSLYRRPARWLPHGGLDQTETFSIVASPRDGWGRVAGALMEASRAVDPVTLGIDAALTVGGHALIADGAIVSDSPPAEAACDSAGSPAAIRHALGSPATVATDGVLDGASIEDAATAPDVLVQALAGQSLRELASTAGIGFGPLFGGAVLRTAPGQWSLHPNLRWGCPSALVSDCAASASSEFPVVAIDADGTPVEIPGGHGQGVLIVVGGDLHLSSDFRFAGIVIVEGGLRVFDGARLEGAVIAAARGADGTPGVAMTEVSGPSSIRFNRCAVSDALRSLTVRSLEAAPWRITRPTFSWFEIVR